MKQVFIILSGGPGVYDPKDKATHDQSWDNFVTPCILRSSKTAIHNDKSEEVHWLVYEPAYKTRWDSDIANRAKAPVQYDHTVGIKGKKFSNYIDLLKKRASERNWKYKGISSASQILDHITGLKGTKVSRLWFYGHARNDLWLSLDHTSDNIACAPSSAGAILNVSDIKKLASFSFSPQKTSASPHKFFGCNTSEFAKEWSKRLSVYAEGAEGKVDFASIHKNGGMVVLSPKAQWLQYTNSGIPVRLALKPGDSVS